MDKTTITGIIIEGVTYTLCKYKWAKHISVMGNYVEEGFCYVSPDHLILIKMVGGIGMNQTLFINPEGVIKREIDENGYEEMGHEITLYDLEGNSL